MDNSDPTSLIILSEIVVIESIIIIGFMVTFFIKRKKTIRQLKEIIIDFGKKIPDRKSSLKSTYSQSPALANTDADKVMEGFVQHEEAFFNTMLSAFEKNDITSIKSIENEIHKLVEPYAQLIGEETAEKDDGDNNETNPPDIESAIDDLLADEADDSEGDPALDLSEETDSDDKIEEIPDELLSIDNDATTTEADTNTPS